MASQAQIDAIYNGAVQRGLDPLAVLSVAQHEGLSGAVGDNGTSFGPFQLHVGGKFPTTIGGQSTQPWTPAAKNAWAWSTAGLSYALDGIAKVVGPLQGYAAIQKQVTYFENPAARLRAGEISAAAQTYTSLSTASQGRSGSGSWLGQALGAAESAAGGAAGAVAGAATDTWNTILGVPGDIAGLLASPLQAIVAPLVAVEKFFKNIDTYLLRGGLLVGAALLLILGLAALGKGQGLQAPLPAAV